MNKPRVFGGHKSTLVYSNNIWFVLPKKSNWKADWGGGGGRANRKAVLVGSKMIVSRHWNYLEVERFGVF